MTDFDSLDFSALTVFVLSWISYSRSVNRYTHDRPSLNQKIDSTIELWMNQVGDSDNRISDIMINASIQNGSVFFASISLIALGGVLSLSQSADQVITFAHSIHESIAFSPFTWKVKTFGLALIFAYAFFQFTWSYVSFSNNATLMGTITPREGDAQEIRRAIKRSVAMTIEASGSFTQGLQALFFALAYLGWFISPYVLILTTVLALFVMWRRQFASDAYDAAE